jgi:Septum formation initiator
VESGDVAGRATDRAPARPRQGRAKRTRSRSRLRVLWLVAFVGVVAFLYYRPLASYYETRNDLAARRAEVEALRVARAGLELRLVNATSLQATQREARRLGYALPGEQLFVVKGIPGWRLAQRRLREDG